MLIIDDLGYQPQDVEESVMPCSLVSDRYECRSLGIISNLVFSEWENIFANPMAAVAAIGRVCITRSYSSSPCPDTEPMRRRTGRRRI